MEGWQIYSQEIQLTKIAATEPDVVVAEAGASPFEPYYSNKFELRG